MMRSLAEFIMKGRLQAAVIALLGIPLLTPATIGIVTLRLGAKEGSLMVLIGLVPALLGIVMGKPSGLFFWGTLITLLVVFVPALILRATASWSFTLLSTTLLVAVMSLVLVWQVTSIADQLGRVTSWFIAMLNNAPVEVDQLPKASLTAVAGLMAFGTVFNGLTGLILSRWWQASLYNPGGFGEEFRALRLDVVPVLLCGALTAFSIAKGQDFVFWVNVFVMPLAVVAIAIVHSFAKAKQLHTAWLIGFYLLVFAYSPMVVLLAIIGFADTWLNFRKRFE